MDNDAEVLDALGINRLYFRAFLDELENREPKIIHTASLIKFINTLGRNKSGSNNAIGRLQFFLNAYIQEMTLKAINKGKLDFVVNDHEYLTRGATGDPAADFKFISSRGLIYTIDAKMYLSEDSFYENLSKTNFHNADYTLIFLIKENRWRYSRKVDNYTKLYTVEELALSDSHLFEIQFPESLTLIRFDINLFDTDDKIPSEISYTFYER